MGLGQAGLLLISCCQGFGLERGKGQGMAKRLTTDSWRSVGPRRHFWSLVIGFPI